MATSTSTAPEQIARRPTRADARRNYDALLAAADTAFTRDGVDTSLEEIARQAGVAIGTLYRHFPTRDALVEAVMRDEVDSLRARAQELRSHPSPGEGLFLWLDALGAHAARYRGLGQSLMAAFRDERSALHLAHRDMQTAAEQLLHRAQEAGAVRSDIDVLHLFTLNCALASALDQGPEDPSYAQHVRTVVYDGLRAG